MTRKPKTGAQRMKEWRIRQAIAEDERLKILLAKTIKLQLFHGTNNILEQLMLETDIGEPQDAIDRLIRGSRILTPEQKKTIFS